MSLSHCYAWRSLTTRCHLLTPASRTLSSAQSACPTPSAPASSNMPLGLFHSYEWVGILFHLWCTLHFIIKSWLREGIVFFLFCCSLFWGDTEVLGDTEIPLPAKSLCLPAKPGSPLNALPGVLFMSSLRMLGHKCLLHPLLCNSECLVVRRLWMVCMAPWVLHSTICTWA